jgi:large conductance mechanosensitive channel
MSFKDFVLRGNVMDLAVGVIIGAAFGKIVDSLVSDIIMPLIASVVGKPDFSEIFIKLGSVPADYTGPGTYAALKAAGVPLLGVGSFFTIILNFLILAFVIYQLVKYTQGLATRFAPPAPPPTEDITLLREIRDSLKK